MTETQLHPAVAAMAIDARKMLEHTDDAVVVHDTETSVALVTATDGWRVVTRFRDQPPAIEAVSDTRAAAELVVLALIAQDWRSQHRLPYLHVIDRGAPAAGVQVTKNPETRWSVTWGTPRRRVTHLNDVRADTLSRLLGHSVEDVVASYQDPDGLPLFPPATPAG